MAELDAYAEALRAEKLRPIGIVPSRGGLAAPRVKDLAEALGATVLRAGDHDQRRIRSVALCAMTRPERAPGVRPGALIITPGDRSDILVAASLAVLNGTPLAGPAPHRRRRARGARVRDVRAGARDRPPDPRREGRQLPRRERRRAMNPQIPPDDVERVERVMNAVADRIDREWVKTLVRTQRVRRLSPPPSGTGSSRRRAPRTSASCSPRAPSRGPSRPPSSRSAASPAACCSANPDEVRDVAEAGRDAPRLARDPRPGEVAPRYVEPLVERRRARG